MAREAQVEDGLRWDGKGRDGGAPPAVRLGPCIEMPYRGRVWLVAMGPGAAQRDALGVPKRRVRWRGRQRQGRRRQRNGASKSGEGEDMDEGFAEHNEGEGGADSSSSSSSKKTTPVSELPPATEAQLKRALQVRLPYVCVVLCVVLCGGGWWWGGRFW